MNCASIEPCPQLSHEFVVGQEAGRAIVIEG